MKGGNLMNGWSRKYKKIMAAFLLFFLAHALFLPLHADGICDEALSECALDAMVTLIFGGPYAFALYSSGCLMGYTWCLKYVDEM
jgi:hypothetical protein